MPLYIYRAKRGPSEIIEGRIEAGSQDQAVSRLNEEGLSPISVAREQVSAKTKLRAEPKKLIPESVRVKAQDINIFTRQLASLVKTSVPILKALALISDQTENRTLKKVVADLEKGVKDGRMLSEAMTKYPRIFDSFYINMIKSGEKAGVLDEVLYALAEHGEEEQGIKREIQAAMAYPALITVVGAGTVFVILTFFMPKLIQLFERMNQQLPLPTRILIGTSEFMSGNWPWFLLAFGFLAVLLGRVQPGSKKKFLFDTVKLRIPFIKKLVKHAEIAKFARTLSLLLKNGIPVYESLDLAKDTLDNDVLRKHLEWAGREIDRDLPH